MKQILDWNYTVENPYKKGQKPNLKILYKQTIKIKELKDELFKIPYIEYKNLKIAKDFNIKNDELIKSLRKYHLNTLDKKKKKRQTYE